MVVKNRLLRLLLLKTLCKLLNNIVKIGNLIEVTRSYRDQFFRNIYS